jgi:putative phosphoribosyl transferase
VVLALVRGGVPVAAEVARRLALPLDLVLLRRLRVREDGGAACAVAAAGTVVLDDEVRFPQDAASAFAAFVDDATAELAARSELCRGERRPRELADAAVLLVDNGIFTGGTVAAAVRALRKLGAARVDVAVPVCNPERRAGVQRLADTLVCLAEPHPFGHVGLWYARYDVPALEEVAAIAWGAHSRR